MQAQRISALASGVHLARLRPGSGSAAQRHRASKTRLTRMWNAAPRPAYS